MSFIDNSSGVKPELLDFLLLKFYRIEFILLNKPNAGAYIFYFLNDSGATAVENV